MSRKLTPAESYARTRKKLGYSHQQMADLLGVKMPTCWRWENGSRRPPPVVDALMVAIYRDAVSVDILQTWMDAASRLLTTEPAD